MPSPGIPKSTSDRGFTLVEMLAGLAIFSIVTVGTFIMVNQSHLRYLNVVSNMNTQEDLYLAALSVGKAFDQAFAVRISATPLESLSFVNGQTGVLREYNFGSITNNPGQRVLIAVFSQNTGSVTSPVYRARALLFQPPTINSPGVLRMPIDATGTGVLNLQTELLSSNLVDLQVTDVRTSGNFVRSFQLRMTARYFEADVPAAQRHYCPVADINANRCPRVRFIDRFKVTTILLSNSINGSIPFAGYQTPLSALTDR